MAHLKDGSNYLQVYSVYILDNNLYNEVLKFKLLKLRIKFEINKKLTVDCLKLHIDSCCTKLPNIFPTKVLLKPRF